MYFKIVKTRRNDIDVVSEPFVKKSKCKTKTTLVKICRFNAYLFEIEKHLKWVTKQKTSMLTKAEHIFNNLSENDLTVSVSHDGEMRSVSFCTISEQEYDEFIG